MLERRAGHTKGEGTQSATQDRAVPMTHLISKFDRCSRLPDNQTSLFQDFRTLRVFWSTMQGCTVEALAYQGIHDLRIERSQEALDFGSNPSLTNV